MTANATQSPRTEELTDLPEVAESSNVFPLFGQAQRVESPRGEAVTEAVISVNVGVPGNIKRISLTGNRTWLVSDALNAAELRSKGYDIRVGGEPVRENSPISDGQTILLLKPVRGNFDLTRREEGGSDFITVNVGVPGNIKKVALPGGREWTVGDALESAGLKAKGYDIRVGGEPVTEKSSVTDGQTVLLLKPVRGNIGLTRDSGGDMITVNVGVPGNIKKVALPAGREWKVKDALESAGLNSTGYDVRVAGEPVTGDSYVADGQTVLLLKPVRGN